MINIINATKRFDDLVAVNNVTLNIDKGIVGIIGQNGAGKSTLLRSIAGVYQLSEGRIDVNGYPSNSLNSKEVVFFLPDEPYAPLNANVKSVYQFYEVFYEIDKERFDQLITLFKLPLDKSVAKFSKGMKRLLFIALALSIKVAILLLDEAFDGIDPLSLQIVKEQIVKVCEKENKTILISSHNISSLEKLVDRFIVINDGIVISQGQMEEMGEKYTKYQAVFEEGTVNQESLEEKGLNIVYYKQVGSFVTFIIAKDERINMERCLKLLNPRTIEEVELEPEEIAMVEMALASKEN